MIRSKRVAAPRRWVAVSIVAAALSAPALAADPKPGLWEYSVEMQMPGMRLPVQSMRNCLTEKDLAERKQFAADPKAKCTMANFKQTGDQVSYEMVCDTDAGKMTISATGTVTAENMQLDTKMKMTGGQMQMPEMSQRITGRRVGECKG
ncbi:MAG TPA: DUF3617 family protein [Burkholderiaceae bacterium]|jgi:hypothetical protein|nr:DUF3617 family protein [Burkholderiaceae bacterium]